MPTLIPFVLAPDDEKQLFDFLARFELTVYPERVPRDWKPFVANAENASRLDLDAYYLAAERDGATLVSRFVKRGKEVGTIEIDETESPVLHYARSVFDEQGRLRSGRLWTYIDLVGDAKRTPAFPESYRRMWLQIAEYVKVRCHRSQPAGWYIGHAAARLSKAGTELREAGRKGAELKPYR